MGVAHVGLVHRDPCKCKVKGFRADSSIERNVSKRRHLQGVRQTASFAQFGSFLRKLWPFEVLCQEEYRRAAVTIRFRKKSRIGKNVHN